MRDDRRGVLFGIAAYGIWGLFPLYWPLLEPAGAGEILAHRMPVVPGRRSRCCCWCAGNGPGCGRCWQPAGWCCWCSPPSISINWGVYIYGVNCHMSSRPSLGYFINPLMTCSLGVLVLHERLCVRRGWQSGCGLRRAVLTVATAGRLDRAGSGVLLRRLRLPEEEVQPPRVEGLAAETAVLFFPRSPCVVFGISGPPRSAARRRTFAAAGRRRLDHCGPAAALRRCGDRLPLPALGLVQYLAPSLQFLVAVVVKHEPLPADRLIGCCLIWLALLVFSFGGHQTRRRRIAAAAPAVSAPAEFPVRATL